MGLRNKKYKKKEIVRRTPFEKVEQFYFPVSIPFRNMAINPAMLKLFELVNYFLIPYFLFLISYFFPY